MGDTFLSPYPGAFLSRGKAALIMGAAGGFGALAFLVGTSGEISFDVLWMVFCAAISASFVGGAFMPFFATRKYGSWWLPVLGALMCWVLTFIVFGLLIGVSSLWAPEKDMLRKLFETVVLVTFLGGLISAPFTVPMAVLGGALCWRLTPRPKH